MDSRIRLHEGRRFVGGRGWVPAYARTTGGGEGSRIRLHGGRLCAETTEAGVGMGSRIRENNGGRLFAGTTEVEARVPASVFMGAGSPRGDGDGSPHPRGQRVGEREEGWWAGWRCGWGVGWVPASVFAGTTGRGAEMPGGAGGPQEQRMEGWVPAYARTTGGWDRFPHPREQRGGRMGSRIRLHWGRLFARGTGMGPRIREDNGGGRFPHTRGQRGGGEGGRMMGWVALRVGDGMGFRIRGKNGWGRGRKDGG